MVGGLVALVGLASLVTSSTRTYEAQGPASAVVVVVVVAALVVEVAYLVALHRARHQTWALPAWAVEPPTG